MRVNFAVQTLSPTGERGRVCPVTGESEYGNDFFDRAARLVVGSAELVTDVAVQYCDGSKLLLSVTGEERF